MAGSSADKFGLEPYATACPAEVIVNQAGDPGTVSGVRKNDDLAWQRTSIGPSVDRGQLTQRNALGDIDVQFASMMG